MIRPTATGGQRHRRTPGQRPEVRRAGRHDPVGVRRGAHAGLLLGDVWRKAGAGRRGRCQIDRLPRPARSGRAFLRRRDVVAGRAGDAAACEPAHGSVAGVAAWSRTGHLRRRQRPAHAVRAHGHRRPRRRRAPAAERPPARVPAAAAARERRGAAPALVRRVAVRREGTDAVAAPGGARMPRRHPPLPRAAQQGARADAPCGPGWSRCGRRRTGCWCGSTWPPATSSRHGGCSRRSGCGWHGSSTSGRLRRCAGWSRPRVWHGRSDEDRRDREETGCAH